MQFKMDAQCFEDLNIFSKDKATYSIFGLFKNVKTLGARERLEEMMRNPNSPIYYKMGFQRTALVCTSFIMKAWQIFFERLR